MPQRFPSPLALKYRKQEPPEFLELRQFSDHGLHTQFQYENSWMTLDNLLLTEYYAKVMNNHLNKPTITLRDSQPGDMGWVVQQHGKNY